MPAWAKKASHPPLDAVDGRDQEVARAHRDVGDAEAPEGLGGARVVAPVVQFLHALQVLGEDRFQRVVQQVLYRELGREVGAGRLALAGAVVEVDLAGFDDDLVFRPGRHVDVLLVDRQVHVGPAQLGLEQPFVDRPELAHGERPKVHGADIAVRGLVDQQVAQGWPAGATSRSGPSTRTQGGSPVALSPEEPARP